MKTEKLFNLSETIAGEFLKDFEHPWEALPKIKDFILELGSSLDVNKFDKVSDDVWIAKSARVFPSAYIAGPAIIDEDAEIRHSAFIRGGVIVGKGAVVGNSTEMKNSIIFNRVQIPHYNYVGDSILGHRAHLGAGAITSNVKSDKTPVTVNYKGEKVATGLKKFGAMVGDFVEVGCNSVLCPGTVVGRNTTIYPLSRVRGYIECDSIFKDSKNIVKKQEG